MRQRSGALVAALRRALSTARPLGALWPRESRITIRYANTNANTNITGTINTTANKNTCMNARTCTRTNTSINTNTDTSTNHNMNANPNARLQNSSSFARARRPLAFPPINRYPGHLATQFYMLILMPRLILLVILILLLIIIRV